MPSIKHRERKARVESIAQQTGKAPEAANREKAAYDELVATRPARKGKAARRVPNSWSRGGAGKTQFRLANRETCKACLGRSKRIRKAAVPWYLDHRLAPHPQRQPRKRCARVRLDCIQFDASSRSSSGRLIMNAATRRFCWSHHTLKLLLAISPRQTI
jgi:hypothetical protein